MHAVVPVEGESEQAPEQKTRKILRVSKHLCGSAQKAGRTQFDRTPTYTLIVCWDDPLLAASRVERAIVVQNVDEFQVVPLARQKIVGVVSRCDLDDASPEIHVHELCVEDDGQAAADDGVDEELAVEALVSERGRLNISFIRSSCI